MSTFLEPHITVLNCKFCGSKCVTYYAYLDGDICDSCGGYQQGRHKHVTLDGEKYWVIDQTTEGIHIALINWASKIRKLGRENVSRILGFSWAEVDKHEDLKAFFPQSERE